MDIIKSAEARKPSVDFKSYNGPVRICERYDKEWGWRVGQSVSICESTTDTESYLRNLARQMDINVDEQNDFESTAAEFADVGKHLPPNAKKNRSKIFKNTSGLLFSGLEFF